MKKVLILLAVLLVFLCGCSKNNTEDENTFTVATFSYTNDHAAFENQPGVQTSGFRNIEPSHISGVEQLIDLAKRECTIDYEVISMAYDDTAKIYKFTFFTETNGDEEASYGVFDVYMSSDGVTQMTICKEAE